MLSDDRDYEEVRDGPYRDYGPIPEACYDYRLSRFEIYEILLSHYCAPERIALLAGSDDPRDIFKTEILIEMVAEIDSETIYWHNYSNADPEQRKFMLEQPKPTLRMAHPEKRKFKIKWSLENDEANKE